MATYSERSEVAAHPVFINRVKQAALEAAVNIHNESDQTPDHDKRIRLAALVVAYPDEWARRLAVGVANNGNIGSGVSDPSSDTTDGDGALAFVVASIWDAYAAGLSA
jgi:hypothetical protein